MTPEQALVLLENLKREAPDKLVAASNTIALEAARWAQQAIVRDRKIYAEVQKINKKAKVSDLPRSKPLNLKDWGFKHGGLTSLLKKFKD